MTKFIKCAHIKKPLIFPYPTSHSLTWNRFLLLLACCPLSFSFLSFQFYFFFLALLFCCWFQIIIAQWVKWLYKVYPNGIESRSENMCQKLNLNFWVTNNRKLCIYVRENGYNEEWEWMELKWFFLRLVYFMLCMQ